jgi:hypothetical protein
MLMSYLRPSRIDVANRFRLLLSRLARVLMDGTRAHSGEAEHHLIALNGCRYSRLVYWQPWSE